MKLIECFIKTLKENIRDWKILILVIVFAPFFVYLFYFYLQASGASSCTVLVLNEDTNGLYSEELIGQWSGMTSDEGKAMVIVRPVFEIEEARKLIRGKEGDLLVIIPKDFSLSFERYLATGEGSLSPFESYGDMGNARSVTAASLIDYAAYDYVGERTGTASPLAINYESAGSQKAASDFDLYVPALLVLSIIMIFFTAGASIVREVEKDTIMRLALSRLTSFEFMAALSLNQVLIGIACMLVTLLASFSVGYKTDGSILVMIVVGVAASYAVVSISLITACFIRNMFGLLTLGCFPFFIMMFFSDCFSPMPKINLIEIAGNQLFLNDLLPTATATRALQKVTVYGAGFADIASVLFAIGILLFRRKYRY
jgi:ABC-2 type transport system permease protein